MNNQYDIYNEVTKYIVPVVIIGTIGYFTIQNVMARPQKKEIVFSIYDNNNNEINEYIENNFIFIKGNASYGNNIYVIDNKNKTNIGYGTIDSYGNFNIPIYLNGIDINNELIDITVISSIL